MANLIKYLQKLFPSGNQEPRSQAQPDPAKMSRPQLSPEESKAVTYLKKLSLLKDTPDEVLARIAGQVTQRELAKGDVLVRQGEPSHSLFIIRKGWVKIVAEGSGGEEVVLNQCGPGQVIGEMSLLDQKPRSNTMTAISPATVLEIKYEAVMAALNLYPRLALSFLRDMSDRLRFANAYIEETIIWSQHIATGDYDFVQKQVQETQSTIVDVSLSDQARASAFLSAFFKMIEGIRKREEKLKQQVHQLTIQIDEAKRQQAVEELTETEFFEQLQTAAQKIRAERRAREGGREEDKPADEA
jgi:CRP-like cAMP-binding protein